jgi:hypothetical protein
MAYHDGLIKTIKRKLIENNLLRKTRVIIAVLLI